MESCYIVTNPKEEEFEESTSVEHYCVCCSSQNKISININTCKHTAFLDNHLKFKYNLRGAHICIICHNMLKKIALFKQQVEESIALLTDQPHILKINKVHNLQRTSIHLTDSTNFVECDFEIKPNVESEENRTDLYTDVKVEHDDDSSDYETDALADVPLSVMKKEKREKLVDKYEGKIKVVTLTLEELKEERENMAKQEKYLSLHFKCVNCIVGFDHELTYKNHMETRHKKTKNSFQCDICLSVLTSKNSYNEHTKRHFNRLECVECGKRYIHGQSAVQHYHDKHLPASSSLLKGYTCRECGFTTTVNRTYRYHMDKHKQKKECTMCDKTFVNGNGLRTHMYTVHNESPRMYRCEPCAKAYRAKSGLLAHIRSAHAPAPRAYCAPCKTHYMTKNALQTHLNTHSRHVTDMDKRFICDECGSKFIKKNSLQIHINWEHLKLNTHRCTKCSKVFRSAPALRRHINYVHEKIRPPRNKICHYCGRGFTSANILKTHLRIHTGERPLQCTHCLATFAQSGALYTHIKLKHK